MFMERALIGKYKKDLWIYNEKRGIWIYSD